MTAAPVLQIASPGAALYALGAGNFVVGLGAFVIIGLLSPILSDLHLSKPEAGALLTAYAVIYAITSPVLVALSGRFDRRATLLGGLALFTAGSLLSALAPSYMVLSVGRVLTALGAAIYTPVASAAGIGLSAPADRAKALGIVFGGLTLAQAAGVPLGSYLGYTLGWRSAMWIVVVLGVIAAVPLLMAVPRGIKVPPASLAHLAGVLRQPVLIVAVSFTVLFIAAAYVVYTYIGPMMEARFGLGASGVTTFLLVFGFGAVIGNALGAWLTDGIGSRRTLALLGSLQLVLLPAFTLLPVGMAGALVLTLVWSLSSWSFMVPQQSRLVELAPTEQGLLLALNASAIYLGVSIGSALGGQVLAVSSFGALGPVGAIIAALALASLFYRGRTPI